MSLKTQLSFIYFSRNEVNINLLMKMYCKALCMGELKIHVLKMFQIFYKAGAAPKGAGAAEKKNVSLSDISRLARQFATPNQTPWHCPCYMVLLELNN